MTGKFITFEGPDGAGKTSQMKRAAQALQEKGYEVILTREPGGTEIGESIRSILLDPQNRMSHRTEALLYAAARAQHVEELILPALQAGKVVLCDRFADSTLAYQGYGRGINLNLLNIVNSLAIGSLKPDLTIILDLDPQVGLNRIRNKRLAVAGETEDRIEMETVEFHQRVREGFLSIALQDPGRYKIIAAGMDEDKVFEKVMACISGVFS
ncbi:thymidylate kinase [Thermincola ferriacetica]|uniref:Thymidylate kinase n=1 Tax=Thermincola ferriacetica TaxID=281456 RepID=A0A0L6W0R8_9FIRM|nr:dTMP kinase [Thermincola ferriacetica]KNZ69177.1 thymidylate kinase [Thermincola ferriacetica]